MKKLLLAVAMLLAALGAAMPAQAQTFTIDSKSDGSPLQATDYFLISRSGTYYKLPGSAVGGSGTIGGGTGSNDNRLLRSDGTGGSTLQASAITVDDSGNMSGVGTLGVGAITSSGTLALSTNSITMTGSLGTTGARLTKVWTAALESTAAPTVGGSAVYYTGGTDVAVADGGTGLSSGTSGGVLCYTASGTLASSSALTANLPVIGGGAGVCPSVGTRSGNTTAYVTTTGTQTNDNIVSIDSNGNHIASGATFSNQRVSVP